MFIKKQTKLYFKIETEYCSSFITKSGFDTVFKRIK